MLCKVISKTTFSNEIVTAQNGEEALQYLNSIKPKDNDSNSKDNLTNFFRFKHACNGGWEILDYFSILTTLTLTLLQN
jgi:hypothetical protein